MDAENDNKKIYSIENFLGEFIEPLYTPYIEKLKRGLILTNPEKKEFAYFIAAQKLRTPKMERIIINEIEVSFRKNVPGNWIETNDIKKFRLSVFLDGTEVRGEEYQTEIEKNKDSIDVDIARYCYLQILPDLISRLADKIANQKWSYLKIPSKRFVITSDNPVVFITETGLSKNIDGYFPLTKQFVLKFNSHEEKVKVIDLKEIKQINCLLVDNSERFVFAHNEVFLRNIVKKYL